MCCRRAATTYVYLSLSPRLYAQRLNDVKVPPLSLSLLRLCLYLTDQVIKSPPLPALALTQAKKSQQVSDATDLWPSPLHPIVSFVFLTFFFLSFSFLPFFMLPCTVFSFSFPFFQGNTHHFLPTPTATLSLVSDVARAAPVCYLLIELPSIVHEAIFPLFFVSFLIRFCLDFGF